MITGTFVVFIPHVFSISITRSLYFVSFSAKYGWELTLLEAEVEENEPATSDAQRVKLKAKHQALEQLESKWEEKPLHGQYPKRTKEKDVDQDKTHNWLSTPCFKSEIEG